MNNSTDFLTMTDEEIDAYIALNETDFNGDLRGRAYKRMQRRNKIKERENLSKNKISHHSKYFGKTHTGCNNAKCKICHYSKVFGYPTLKEVVFMDKERDELAELNMA